MTQDIDKLVARVERFQAIGTDEDPYMVPTTKGPWVRYSDYEALRAQVAESRLAQLKAENGRLQAKFDAMVPEQEALAIEFCIEIAGPRGKKPRPPDPVRLLEMAEALYRAEIRAALTGREG